MDLMLIIIGRNLQHESKGLTTFSLSEAKNLARMSGYKIAPAKPASARPSTSRSRTQPYARTEPQTPTKSRKAAGNTRIMGQGTTQHQSTGEHLVHYNHAPLQRACTQQLNPVIHPGASGPVVAGPSTYAAPDTTYYHAYAGVGESGVDLAYAPPHSHALGMMAHYLDGHFDPSQPPVEGANMLGMYGYEGMMMAPSAPLPIYPSARHQMRSSGPLHLSASAPAGYSLEEYHNELPIRPSSAFELSGDYTQNHDNTESVSMVQSESVHSYFAQFQQQTMAGYDAVPTQQQHMPDTISPRKIHSSSPPMPYTHEPENFTMEEMAKMQALHDGDLDSDSEVSA